MGYQMFEEYPQDQEPASHLGALGHDSDKPEGHVERISDIHRAKPLRERLRRPDLSSRSRLIIKVGVALTCLLLLDIAGEEQEHLVMILDLLQVLV